MYIKYTPFGCSGWTPAPASGWGRATAARGRDRWRQTPLGGACVGRPLCRGWGCFCGLGWGVSWGWRGVLCMRAISLTYTHMSSKRNVTSINTHRISCKGLTSSAIPAPAPVSSSTSPDAAAAETPPRKPSKRTDRRIAYFIQSI